ncbi:hypothetical protein FKM82_026178 [Ascaphus truei]
MSPTAVSLLLGLVLCCVGTWAAAVTPRDEPRSKPGTCPNDVSSMNCELVRVAPQCDNDRDCEGTMKCCYSDCTQRCVPPLEVKPGDCPIPNTRCMTPLPPPLCTSDSQCDGDKKCCTPWCQQECTDPINLKYTKN